MAAAKITVPEGYRIERDSEREFSSLTPEIQFRVFEAGNDVHPVTTVGVYWSRRDGWWWIRPGSSTSRMEGPEVRARIAAFEMAVEEWERRQGTDPDAS